MPLHKIRADPTSRHAVNTATASLRQEIAECGLRIGNQIVWLSDNGPEYGEVKWVGVLPDSRRNDITVGVEFVSNNQCIMFLNINSLCTPKYSITGKNIVRLGISIQRMTELVFYMICNEKGGINM